MTELLLTIILSFGVGTALGVKSGQQLQEKTVVKQPDNWDPKSHKDMIKVCSLACGEDRFLEYNMIHGKCKCSSPQSSYLKGR